MYSFIFTQNAHGKTDQGPEMNAVIIGAIVLRQVVYLGVAVMAGRNHVIGAGGLDLVELEFSIGPPFILPAILQESATTAATVVIGQVRCHVDKVFLPDQFFQDIAHIFTGTVAVGLSHQLAGILQGEFDVQVPVPVRRDRKFAFPDPFGVFEANI